MTFTVDYRGVIRLGDATSHGGKVIAVSSTTTVGGICVARIGDQVTCPKCKGVYTIVEGEPTSLDDGIPIALHGHKTSCGASLISSV
jgi:uncharacterized Zn-binding protein involved in type VI secretion